MIPRKCKCKKLDGVFVFHGFFQYQIGDNEACPVAVIESEDGSIAEVDASRITFLKEGQK